MANKTYKTVTIKYDNASQALTDISAYCNQHSLQGVLSQLEDSGFGMNDKTYVPGIHGKNGSINGFVNSTTYAMFAPLVTSNTSVTKTFQLGTGNGFIYGEVVPGTTQFSGSVDSWQTFSHDFVFTVAATRTSVTQV